MAASPAIADCRFINSPESVVRCWLQVAGSRLQASGGKLQIVACSLQPVACSMHLVILSPCHLVTHHATTLASRKVAISLSRYPSSRNVASVCWPRVGGGVRTDAGVAEKR